MVKLIIPILLTSAMLFVSCLYVGFVFKIIKELIAINFALSSKSQGSDYEGAVPALKL